MFLNVSWCFLSERLISPAIENLIEETLHCQLYQVVQYSEFYLLFDSCRGRFTFLKGLQEIRLM